MTRLSANTPGMAAETIARRGFNEKPARLPVGLVRFLHLQHQTAFVPLLIEVLATHPGALSVPRWQTRFLLTSLLPLWCEQDTVDLTQAQQKILLLEIENVTRDESASSRTSGCLPTAMTLADADFALAAVATLRRYRVPGDATWRVFSQLTAPVTENDPRHKIHQAIEILVSEQCH